MPGHSEMKKKVKGLLGKKGTKIVNQVVKKGVNKARQAVKSKAMKDERVKKVAKAIPKPLSLIHISEPTRPY